MRDRLDTNPRPLGSECFTSWIRMFYLERPSVLPREAECFILRGRVFFMYDFGSSFVE